MSDVPTPVKPPEQWDRRDYAALPTLLASNLRKAWRAAAGPLATTPNGAPFPLRSWPPDAAIDIQHLAEWVDPLKPPNGIVVPALRGRFSGSTTAGTGRFPVTFNAEKFAWGGMAFNDADGTVIVPKAGLYSISGTIIFWQIAATTTIVQADVGSLTARYGWGMGRTKLPNNYATDSFAVIKQLAAGDKISLWSTTTTSMEAVEGAALNVEWIGAAT